MRVLMLTALSPPHIAGTELHVRNLSRALAAPGHAVAAAPSAIGPGPSAHDDEGVLVYREKATTVRSTSMTPSGRSYMPPAPDPEVLMALRRLIADERPDVVHAHNWIVHSYVPLKRSGNAPLVVTLHDYSTICAKRSLLYRG